MGATPEENYDEEYVIIILAEKAELNLKYGQLFEDHQNAANASPKEQRTNPNTKLSTKPTNYN